jgi:hypothetical protein
MRVAGTIEVNPSENSNWRKHKNACPMYRERWFPCNDISAGEPMYQVFCMQGTPPVTWEEQDRCMHSKNGCWRRAHEASCREPEQKKRAAHSTASPSTSR